MEREWNREEEQGMKLSWNEGGRCYGSFLRVQKEVFKKVCRWKCVIEHGMFPVRFPEGFGKKGSIISFETLISTFPAFI